MVQRHLFIIDPLSVLHPSLDTSLHLAHALSRRGHQLFAAQPWHLRWLAPDPAASIRAARLLFKEGATASHLEGDDLLPLTHFTAIHMRKDPPFDLEYIATTWELESVARQVHVINHPSALRTFNEKLSIFRFPEECRPALVSADPQDLLTFIVERAGGDAILKPLMQFGGRGVRRVRIAEDELTKDSAYALLLEETNEGRQPRIVQPFDPHVFEGEVRAFTMAGQPLAWCLKKPAHGQFLANTRAGATLHPYEPTAQEVGRVTRVAQALARRGVAFAGFDLIGGYVSEINITSPRLLYPPGDRRDYFGPMAEWVESICRTPPRAA